MRCTRLHFTKHLKVCSGHAGCCGQHASASFSLPPHNPQRVSPLLTFVLPSPPALGALCKQHDEKDSEAWLPVAL